LAVVEPKVLILGGYERMLPLGHFSEFAVANASTFRKILVIGASGERMAGALKQAGFENFLLDTSVKTMSEIIAKARALAQPGDAVLLSPGFASFDMFKNFEERGNQFREVVNGL
jgi:UDP-N-acetylmuramoylalanine--D-glutamate ligase